MKKVTSLVLVFSLSLIAVLGTMFTLPAKEAYAVETKITLTTSMVTNESGLGSPTMLVDEQAAAGDPANGTGGAPTTTWQAGWNQALYPAYAYIDLGQSYNLTSIYLRDTYDVSNLTVYSGSPGSWTALFTDPLTGYMTWNAHTVSVATRYVRVALSATNTNMSEIVIYGTVAGGDTTAPAAVTNLAAPTATSSSVNLTWTAPGDDGATGTAASYDIRYSTSTITAANWGSATQVSGEPAPTAAGTSQSKSVTGLSASTTYYFAMKTSDEAPNVSALSNVVNKATTAAGSAKLTLTTSMVTNESGLGVAANLVDEQTLSGDPKNSPPGGSPNTYWQPYGGYPASAYIDLGQSYNLTHVYLHDKYDIGNITISSGSPGSWTSMFVDPMANYDVWNAHTVSVATRYVRVTHSGSNSQTAEIVLYGTPVGGGDTTAPSAVTNLAAPTSTSSSVNLTWTAPGDDGATGTAASYDIRYSTSTITAANFASATEVSGEPAPTAAGTSQSKTVTGLSASTTYYFAMKTSDEVANASALSNVVSKATTSAPAGGKITLTASMILNEVAIGAATNLVDEQALSGDPKAGTGGVPVTKWDTTWSAAYYPASAVIDLGTTYTLTDMYFYDSDWGGTAVTVSTGTPFSWTTQFTENLSSTSVWVARPVSVSTRYIQLKTTACCMNFTEIVLYGTAQGTPTPTPTPTVPTPATMDKLIGINAFIDDPIAKMQVAGFVREYHNWNWDEGDIWPFGPIATGYPGYPNNANKFNPSYAGGGGWNFDAYYSSLKTGGITVSPAIQGAVSWLEPAFGNKPVASNEDPLVPASYAEHADHMYQYAARYGSTVVADNKLKLAAGQPRSTGLNTLTYFEDWNEQDNWWVDRDTHFSPYEYAAMASADYDGHQGNMGNTFGVKNADPNAKLVMGGLARPELEYIRSLKFWADYNRGGSVPFDVINIHHYSNNGSDQTSGSVGISPEADSLKEKLKKFTDYRNSYMPGKEVWITEFGYDTHQASVQRAPAIGATSEYEVQADWLVRSYLAAAAAGIDKTAMFMLRDVDPASTTMFDTSGLTSSVATGWVPKISWYYVYTLKNRLTGMHYLSEPASGNGNVRIYKFKNAAGTNGGYVIWCPTANNTTVNSYQLTLAGTPSTATLVTMANGDTDGVPSTLTITAGKVTVNVSERPIFVLVNNIQ